MSGDPATDPAHIYPVSEDFPLKITVGILETLQTSNDVSTIQQATETLVNLTATSPTERFMALDGLDVIKHLLQDPESNSNIIEHATRLVANVARKSERYRNAVIDIGVFQVLLDLVVVNDSPYVLRGVSKALRVVCCEYSEALPHLTNFRLQPAFLKLLLVDDTDVIRNATLLIACMCNPVVFYMDRRKGPNFNEAACVRLVHLLDEKKYGSEVLSSTMLTLAMISALSWFQSDLLIDCGIAPALNKVMKKCMKEEHLVELFLVIVKNITSAAQSEKIEQIIDNDLLTYPLDFFSTGQFAGADPRTRYLIASALNSATIVASSEQIRTLVDHECIPLLISILDDEDPENNSSAIQALKNILDKDKVSNSSVYHDIVLDCHGVERIGKLTDAQDLSSYAQEVASYLYAEFTGGKRKKNKLKNFFNLRKDYL